MVLEIASENFSHLQEMVEDCLIRSGMERLNDNLVSLALSNALMKLVDLKPKDVWVS